MGSNNSSSGNAAGRPLVSFTAAGDSGPLLYHVAPAGTPQHHYSEIRGNKDYTIGLTGPGTGLAVTVYFTTDVATAMGTAQNWFLAPSPSSENSTQWSNPMVNVVGQNVVFFRANAIALRFVAAAVGDGTPITGTTTVNMLASF